MDAKQEFKYIAEAVKAHRKAEGMTQKQVATAAKVSAGLVSDIENAKATVQTDNLLKVLNVLELHVELVSPITRLVISRDKPTK